MFQFFAALEFIGIFSCLLCLFHFRIFVYQHTHIGTFTANSQFLCMLWSFGPFYTIRPEIGGKIELYKRQKVVTYLHGWAAQLGRANEGKNKKKMDDEKDKIKLTHFYA